MIINEYLDDAHAMLLLENYSSKYLETIDEVNFKKIYMMFKLFGFDFLDDIIVRYLEIFTLDYEEVLNKITSLKENLGNDYIDKISNDMSILKKAFLTEEYND